MKLIRFYILILILFLGFFARGQADVQLSQQTLSKINFNPSATGFSNYANANLFIRQQWAGFEDAPLTQAFNAQGYIEDIRSGVGFSLINDRVGNNNMLNMIFAYGYHIEVGAVAYLSLGIGAGLFTRRFGGDILFLDPETDPDIINMATNGMVRTRPDMSIGMTYSTPEFSFGLSATHITRYFFPKNDWFKLPLHAYMFADYIFEFGENVLFTPRIQIMSVFSDVQSDSLNIIKKIDVLYEAGGHFTIADKFWIGASWRNGDAISAMIGFNLGTSFRLGYSYDFKIGSAFKNVRTYGSHEIMLNYRMKLTDEENSEATPRFFD